MGKIKILCYFLIFVTIYSNRVNNLCKVMVAKNFCPEISRKLFCAVGDFCSSESFACCHSGRSYGKLC